MLVGEIGEDRDVVRHLPNPLQREPVRGRLDYRRSVAGPGHRPQRPLELGSLGSRHVGGRAGPMPADSLVGRTDQARPDPGRLERRDRHGRGGRLPVGPGHADHAQPTARVAVPPGRRHRERELASIHDELGGGPRVGHVVLDDDRDRAGRHRAGDEGVPVDVRTWNGDEEAAGDDPPRVVGKPDDRAPASGRRDPAAQASCRRQAVDEIAERADVPRLRGCQQRLQRGVGALRARLAHRPFVPEPRAARRIAPGATCTAEAARWTAPASACRRRRRTRSWAPESSIHRPPNDCLNLRSP